MARLGIRNVAVLCSTVAALQFGMSPNGALAQKNQTKVNAVDKAAMILIPKGPFTMGDDAGAKGEGPAHKVTLSSYWIYKHEVTVAQYLSFVGATKRRKPSKPKYGFHDNYPVVYANWKDADAYCKWAGGALPTEAQWEKAARGTDGRKWPWGNTYSKQNAWAGAGQKREPKAVGSFPTGASPYGVLDMTGNVAEWVNDHLQRDYYAKSPKTDPTGPARGQRVVRGGAHNVGNTKRLTTFARSGKSDSTASGTTGFRCAQAG